MVVLKGQNKIMDGLDSFILEALKCIYFIISTPKVFNLFTSIIFNHIKIKLWINFDSTFGLFSTIYLLSLPRAIDDSNHNCTRFVPVGL